MPANDYGKLISLEGIDGCGKSTLAQMLAVALRENHKNVVLTKEFGGTPLGISLRELLHIRTDPISSKAEFLLIAADRAQHFETVVIPALRSSALVISDRMNDSSLAYQGYGRGIDLKMITTINAWAMCNIKQDLIFFIDIDLQTALSRIYARNEQLTSFEKEKIDFWQRVYNGYREIFRNRPEVVVLDGCQPPTMILEKALGEIKKRGLVCH
jgi:dTMP kinase